MDGDYPTDRPWSDAYGFLPTDADWPETRQQKVPPIRDWTPREQAIYNYARSEVATLTTERDKAEATLEMVKALADGYGWLSEGRGPYAYDDAHYDDDVRTFVGQLLEMLPSGNWLGMPAWEAKFRATEAERDRYREALEEAKKVIGYESQGYGSFPGGDPRNFTPDEEENTPEELAAWKAACEAWDRGEGKDTGPQCQTMGDGSVVTGTGYGMGTYQWPHPAIEYIDAIAEGRALAGTGETPRE